MKAMILAAGLGTRLRPLTNHLPKPLLPLGDRPLIHYNLLLLKKYGITEVLINLHHYGDKLKKALGNGADLGMQIHYSEEPVILGTGGGLKKVTRFFSNGSFILINADILVDLNLDKVVEHHQRRKAAATLILREDPRVDHWGVIEADQEGRVRQLLQRGDWKGGKLSRYMFTGIHVLEPRIFNYIPDRQFYSIIDSYIEMVKKNERVFGYIMKGYWMDLGTPERYQKTRLEIEKGTLKLSYLR